MITKLALDQLLDTVTIIIAENNEDGLEFARMTSADNLMNLNQSIIRDDSGEL